MFYLPLNNNYKQIKEASNHNSSNTNNNNINNKIIKKQTVILLPKTLFNQKLKTMKTKQFPGLTLNWPLS